MNQESHDIHPSFILKFLGAKTLNLKVKNLEINSIHKSSSKFDITQIKKLKIKKGLLFNDLEVLLDTHSISF
jgi:hypothetical protein